MREIISKRGALSLLRCALFLSDILLRDENSWSFLLRFKIIIVILTGFLHLLVLDVLLYVWANISFAHFIITVLKIK